MQTKKKKTLPYKVIKINADTLTPVGIYTNLTGKKKFLLESSFPHEKKGKFSFIGANPCQEFIGEKEKTIVIDHENGTKETLKSPALSILKERLPNLELDLDLPFIGGAIGYIGYDAIRSYEQIGEELPDTVEMPEIHLMIYKNVIAFDHRNETAHLIVMNPDQQSETVLDERLEKLKSALIASPISDTTNEPNMIFKPEMDKQQFMENVKIAKKHIQQGDAFQIVLSQRMKAPISGDPFSFYRKLRKANPSPYMFYIDFEAYQVLGASPESLVQSTGNRVVTNPIAGTRPRGKNEQEEEELTKELLADEKEIAEHRMLVDLSRNDIGRVSEIDSITIPTYMQVEKYQHVMHIVSEVHGKLNRNYSGIDALIACLPAGTVSGAPKIRAMQIINDLEKSKRGVYGGGIGYINFNHDVNMALAIRSLVIKEKYAYLQVGAGVVYDSVPENEYFETLHKARSLMEVNHDDSSN